MPRILAIDSDRHELRLVVLDRDATSTRLRHALSVPIGDDETGKSAASQAAEMVSGEGLGRARTTAAIGRDQVQLKLMELPPCPADELPQMVQFQAERELATLGPHAALDFWTLSGGPQEPYRVLAAALGSDGLAAVRTICKTIGSEPANVTLQGTSAASLLRRAPGFDEQTVAMLAVPLAEQAELIVVADGQPVLLRTVRLPAVETNESAPRLPGEEPSQAATDASLEGMIAVGLNRREATLACEIRRTLAASHQQLGDRSVDIIYLAAPQDGDSTRNTLLSRQLRTRCETLDPFRVADECGVAGADQQFQLADRGRFAGVIGLALDTAENQSPAFDFLHPRRTEEKSPVQRVHILAAAAVLVIFGVLGWWVYDQSAGTAAELADLQTETADRQQIVDQFADVEAQAAEIETWLASDVNWLDELERLSHKWRPKPLDADDFSNESDAVLTLLFMKGATSEIGQIGQMTISAAGRSPAVIPPLENRLRDATHHIIGRVIEQDDAVEGYPSRFEMDVEVLSKDELAAGGEPE